jgi:nucleoside-diphosphate-sugar epimerase
MKVLILGATGTIGSAVALELARLGHDVLGLSRRIDSDRKLTSLGLPFFRGDIREPGRWAHLLDGMDAVIQTACTFTDDMAEVDAGIVDALIAAGHRRVEPLRVLYTGGCWLYGATGDRVAADGDAFAPIEAFTWMLRHGESLLAAPGLSTAVIHPAMVYGENGGAFARMTDDARAGRPIEYWGSIETRWPLIHGEDLASAYALLLAAPDLTGHFNASAEDGVALAEIVAYIAIRHGATRFRRRGLADVLAEHGAWAEGPTLDQQMAAEKLKALGWLPRHRSFKAAIG